MNNCSDGGRVSKVIELHNVVLRVDFGPTSFLI